jgi:hypothetical protein
MSASFIKYLDAEVPLYGSALLKAAKTELQNAGHPVQRDKFGITEFS